MRGDDMANYGFTIKQIRENAYYLYRWTYMYSEYYKNVGKELGLTEEEVIDVRFHDKDTWNSYTFQKARDKVKTISSSKLVWQCLGRWRAGVPKMKDITIDETSDTLTPIEEKILKMSVVGWYFQDLAKERLNKNGTEYSDEMKFLHKEKNKRILEVQRKGYSIEEAEDLVLEEYNGTAKKHPLSRV
jgi:hypothetical protein